MATRQGAKRTTRRRENAGEVALVTTRSVVVSTHMSGPFTLMRSSRERACAAARDCRPRRPALLLSRAWTPPSPSSCLEAPAPPAADRPVQLFVLAGLHPRQVGAQHSLDAPPRSSSSCWALSRPATYSTPEPVTRGRTGLSLARPELCMRVPASCSSICDTAPRPRPVPSWPVPRLRPRYPRPHTWASRGAEAKARLEM